jgi:hypothetical protein
MPLANVDYNSDPRFGLVKPAGEYLSWHFIAGVWQSWWSGTEAECERYGGLVLPRGQRPPATPAGSRVEVRERKSSGDRRNCYGRRRDDDTDDTDDLDD